MISSTFLFFKTSASWSSFHQISTWLRSREFQNVKIILRRVAVGLWFQTQNLKSQSDPAHRLEIRAGLIFKIFDIEVNNPRTAHGGTAQTAALL